MLTNGVTENRPTLFQWASKTHIKEVRVEGRGKTDEENGRESKDLEKKSKKE